MKSPKTKALVCDFFFFFYILIKKCSLLCPTFVRYLWNRAMILCLLYIPVCIFYIFFFFLYLTVPPRITSWINSFPSSVSLKKGLRGNLTVRRLWLGSLSFRFLRVFKFFLSYANSSILPTLLTGSHKSPLQNITLHYGMHKSARRKKNHPWFL